MTLLINWWSTSVWKVTISTQVQTNIKFNNKFNTYARLSLNRSRDRPNRRNLGLVKMWKRLNRRWKTNSIIKTGRFRLYILTLRKEEQLHVLQLLIIWEDKLHNGKFGILILRNLKEKTRMNKREETKRKKRNPLILVDGTQLLSSVAWRLWREWFVKTNKTKNTTIISTTGRKVKKLRVLRVNCSLFGDSVMRRKRSM